MSVTCCRTLSSVSYALRLAASGGLLAPVCAAGAPPAPAPTSATEEHLVPVLPPAFYAVPGRHMSVYFDNVVLTQHPEKYRFKVTCRLGRTEERRWTVTPSPTDAGRHRFELAVYDGAGRLRGRSRSTLCVAPADAGAGRSIRLMFVGDSLTHATVYPTEIARLLSRPNNPEWTMLGTQRSPAAAPGAAHEGYGGWTWQRFLEHYEPHPDGTYRKRSSPFVFVAPDTGKPRLDLARYFRERTGGILPDAAVFLLGINDCFHVNPDDPDAVDKRIDRVLGYADALLNAFRATAPGCLLGVCLTPPPNIRESAFQANYKGKHHWWGWKRIQFRLVQRMIDHFRSGPDRKVTFVPTELNLDSIEGFPENNAVHPNRTGYGQIADAIYAWLKWQMAAGAAPSGPAGPPPKDGAVPP